MSWEGLQKALNEACAERDALKIRVAELDKSASQWIPVGERLPEDRKAVLVWCPERMNRYSACWIDGSWSYFGGCSNYRLLEEVTHWKPMSAPPSAETATKEDTE